MQTDLVDYELATMEEDSITRYSARRPLHETEKVLAGLHLDRLSAAEGIASTVYRGEGLDFAAAKLPNHSESVRLDRVLDVFFFCGAKSKSSLCQVRSQTKAAILKHKSAGHYLYVSVARVLSDHEENFEGTRFVRQFEDIDESIFAERFAGLTEEDGELVWDYYSRILHTAAYKGYEVRVETEQVSTTKDYAIAREYALGEDEKDTPLVIVAVVPKKMLEEFLDRRIAAVENAGLPLVDDGHSIFNREKELTLPGGIFPHNIVGIAIPNSKQLVLNPWLFRKENTACNLLQEGLFIDQEGFEGHLLWRTHYQAMMVRDAGALEVRRELPG